MQIRKWHIAAASAAVAALAFVAVAVTGVGAQTPVPGASSGQTFLDRVASKLGIPTSSLRDAVNSASNDEIDARVASGELTQQQADALKRRIASAPDGAFGFRGPGFGRGHGPGGPHGVDPDVLASFLGTDAATLRTELQADGATLATVAQAHGRSRDELKSFLSDQIKAHLDQEVADGRITQAEADQKLADATANLDAAIDRGGPPFGGRHHRFDDDGDAPGAPVPSSATPSGGA
jgi:uncharacterized protein YidB (DUF937 family)